MNIVVYRYRNNTYLKDFEEELKLTEYEKLLAKRVYHLSYNDIFIKCCIALDETTDSNSVAHGRSPSCKHFPILLESEIKFRHNSASKNLFLNACYNWNDKISLPEMDQNFPFGGLIGFGNSYLDSIFCYSKVFRIHAILHDAAGAVGSQSGKLPGYCYMIGQRRNSCLVGNLTG